MGITKKQTNLFLTVIILVVTSCTSTTPELTTVIAGESVSVLDLMPSEQVTYRVIMPDRQACPAESNSSFDWKIQFRSSASVYGSQICVDFGRLRLRGNSTQFTVRSKLSPGPLAALTPTEYPLKRRSMSTVKCCNYWDELILTFHSHCHGNLRDYFRSWIYVYHQVRSSPVYHLDGTCRHSYSAIQSDTQLTLRSYVWNDTVGEADPQHCSLKVSALIMWTDRDVKFCTKWKFGQTACGLSAHQKKSDYYTKQDDAFDYKDAKNATCQTGFSSARLDTCLPYGLLTIIYFGARRVGGTTGMGETIEDGALFFEVETKFKEERPTRKTYNDYSSPDEYGETDDSGHGDYSSGYYGSDDFNGTIFFKTLAPVALLMGVCCCLCGICHKQKKQAQAQAAAATDYASVLPATEHARPAPVIDQTIAMQPLIGPGRNTDTAYTSSSWAANRGPAQAGATHWERSEAAAPPPSYGDVTSTPHASPRPPPHRSAADYEPPPPPFSPTPSAPPAAPPAYHELFPSNP